MADLRAPTQSAQNREFWTEFFLLYESLPALWNTGSILYKERAAKIAGYDIMVEKLREIEPNSDREDVLRKINIFRTNFRREISRINMSNKMGKQYRTTLWYFDLLSFLQTQESRKSRRSKPDAEKCIMPKKRFASSSTSFVVKNSHTEKLEPSSDFDEDGLLIEYEENHEDSMPHNTSVINTTKDMQYQNVFHNFSTGRKGEPKLEPLDHDVGETLEDIEEIGELINDDDVIVDEDIEAACIAECEQETDEWSDNGPSNRAKKLKPDTQHFVTHPEPNQPSTSQVQKVKSTHAKATQTQSAQSKSYSEASEILAKSWAIQYEEMSDDQKIYARKAIADILFDGCMGNLGGNIVMQQQDESQCIIQGGTAISSGEAEQRMTVANERTLLKRQHLTNSYQDVVNNFEECYVFDNGQAVKLQDWAVKMK